jgi:zinc transport system permease protein
MSLFEFGFIWRALTAAAIVGITAPAIGVFLVQRRLALMGDGIGHVALTGVALGLLTSTSPTLVALVTASIGAIAIEFLRARGRAAGDVALALLFYGGIAGGVFLAGLSSTTGPSLFSYLFGSVLTVDKADLIGVAILSALVLATVYFLSNQLFVLCYDEELARVAGLRVPALSLSMAVLAAVTVVVAMRVVGLLMVAALMVVPVAAVENLARSFKATLWWSILLGCFVSIGGVVLSFYIDTFPGPTIVLTALAVYLATTVASRLRPARQPR